MNVFLNGINGNVFAVELQRCCNEGHYCPMTNECPFPDDACCEDITYNDWLLFLCKNQTTQVNNEVTPKANNRLIDYEQIYV